MTWHSFGLRGMKALAAEEGAARHVTPEPTDSLVERVRRGIEADGRADAALTELAEKLQAAERERDILFKGDWAMLNQRVERAEAQLVACREALRKIESGLWDGDIRTFARRALSDGESGPTVEHRGSCRVYYAEGYCTCGADGPTGPVGHETC